MGEWSPTTFEAYVRKVDRALAKRNRQIVGATVRADEAVGVAAEAMLSANGKNTIWRSPVMPEGDEHLVGDTWFDQANDNTIYTWDGDSWEPMQFGEGAIQDLAITNAKIAYLDAAKVTTGFLSTDRLEANSITSPLIAADAITAKHTITGATIRTAADGARTELTNQGMQVLNSSGNPLVRLGYNIPTGMSIADPNTGSLVPLASMSFGTKNFPTNGNGTTLNLPVASAAETWGSYATETHGDWVAPSSRVLWLFFALSDNQSINYFQPQGQAYLVDSTDTSVGARVNLTTDLWVSWSTGFFMGVRDVVQGRMYSVRNSFRAMRYTNYQSGQPTAKIIARMNILIPI